MSSIDPRTYIAAHGRWRKLAHSEVCGQAVVELHQYVNASGDPQELYRTIYGLEQKDWDDAVKAQEAYQSSVLHQWNCAGFTD